MSTIRYSHPTKSTAPAWTFNAGLRPKTKHPNAPGPGAYNSSPVSKKSSSKFPMTDRDAFPEMNWETPGPGYYASSSRLSEAPSYSLGPRNFTKTDKHLQGVPGPANYSPKLTGAQKGPAFSMGQRRIHVASDDELPGPGAYDVLVPDKLNKSYHFGTSTSKSDLDSELPGPGQYELSKQRGSPSYMFASGSKLHSYIPKKTERMPGPGSYLQSPKNSSPASDKGFTFVPRRSIKKPDTIPWTVGPGTYNSSPTNNFTTPSFGFSKSKRFAKSKDIIPAANFYDPQAEGKGGMPVSFGTTKRPDHFRNKSTIPAPGPGYYKVKNDVP